MDSSFAHRFSLRTGLVFVICVALLALPNIPILVSGAVQKKGEAPGPKGKPRPGRPEGVLPDLEAVKKDVERQAPPPLPSTIRSPKNPLQPWNGRRVGDPGTQMGQGFGKVNNVVASNKHRTRLAHARRKMLVPPPLLDDQFIQNFFTWTVSRAPSGTEPTFWNDQFRVAYAQGQTSLKLAAVELGKTLFESAEYAARNRDNHWYVYDLYKTFLMRDPDASGWAYWESVVPANGRENVRRAFEVCSEFETIVNSITPNGSATANAASLISARVDPRNQPGNGMLTRDMRWSVPLISLPGRAGLDLGLTLSYSSMVWTRSGPYIHFDEDNGFPSPGFRLGFPIVQRKVFDAQTAKNSFLLVTPGGQRVELRQVGTSNIYEAADSSYLQLTDNSPNLLVRSTDGTQLSFVEINNEYSCTQIKDRNGNYISVGYSALGRITTISDTLGRVVNFNYDSNANLISITQSWNGQPSHQWVSFGWGTRTMQSSFSDSSLRGVIGPANGTSLPVITQVALNDTSYFTFDYTNSLQVSVVRNYFETERNSTTFTYETPAGDAPRLLDSRISAQNWTGINGVPSQVITQYSVAGDGACVMTAPDGTVYKEYYGTGWQKGLTTLSEVWTGSVKQKWTTTAWTQDNTSVGYEMNPRVTETNVYDAGSNHRRTAISYYPASSFSLPSDTYEYAANGTTVLRRTHINYNLSATYTDRRIIGLPSGKYIFDGNDTLYWFDVFDYDYSGGFLIDTPQTPTQHDPSYGVGFVAGRGNLSIVRHTDATDPGNQPVHDTLFAYNKTGSVTSTIDPLGHTKSFGYTDSFSDAVNRNTYAYHTTLTDEDGFSSYLQYNFDFGAITRSQSPAPAGQSQGAIQTLTYNGLGQLERTTTTNNGAYTRYVHGSYYVQAFSSTNNIADEAYNIEVFDGVGRVRATAANHPGSTGGYRAQLTTYDLMGRSASTSNPFEITGTWAPAGDDAGGAYYTTQTYDWKGRPLRTTHPDTTYKEASYSGCGCAGGEVATLTDEGTIDAGVAKRRQQRIYSDVLGRTVKTEILNWQNGTVYSALVNTYNVRDQLTQIRQYAGAEGSGTYQDTTMTYDGYGRLKTKHVPEQNAGANTVWTYNADDTVQSVTDARGATTNFTYNNRRLIANVSWSVPAPSPTPIPTPAAVSFAYDAVGNRTSMTDGFGNVSYEYYPTSRLKSETRTLTGVTNPNSADGKFKLSYDYNLAGQLNKFTDAANMTINYAYGADGRVSGVTGSDTLYANVSNYASNFQYRAWGGLKSMTDGKGNTRSLTYNSRGLPTHFEVSGSIVSQNYDYYDDGALSFVHNLSDNNFDRSYRYDHASRLAEAKTGGTARNGVGDTPFYESFGYDVFNNLTSRQTNTWNDQTMASDAASYSNHRRLSSGWSYDEDGRNLTIVSRSNRYDASGRQAQMNSNYVVLGHNVNVTQNFGYDGVGARISESISTVTTYYLTSSVIGAVVEELDGSGQKTAGFVYSPGGELLATQTPGNSTNAVTWKHLTSSGTSEYSINTENSTVGRVEFDPLHADVSTTAPTNPPSIEGQGEVNPNHLGNNLSARFGDIFNTAAGCMIDGIPSTCDMAMNLRNRGAGDRVMKALSYNHERGVDWYGDVQEEGVAGFSFVEFHDATGTLGGEIQREETRGEEHAPDTFGEVRGGTRSSFVYIYMGATFASTTSGLQPNYIEPQDTGRVPLTGDTFKKYEEVRQKLLKLLLDKNSDCAKFLRTKVGISGSRIARTVAAQRPFDGRASTISAADAGLLPVGVSTHMGNVEIKSTDQVNSFARIGADAVQAGYARASTGATFHDVYYFSNDFFSEAQILHEAIHTLLGTGDDELRSRHADLQSLGKGGCNFLGRAVPD
jgi:YD repeat-containing protein